MMRLRSSVAFARRAQLLRVPLRPPAVVSSLPAAAVRLHSALPTTWNRPLNSDDSSYFLHTASTPDARPAAAPVTESEVLDVQERWAAAIARISAVYKAEGDYVAAAADAAGELYAYGHHDVLFKPTKAADFQFRPTAAEAMSYFVGGAAVGGYEEDGGFAINGGNGFKEVSFDNHSIDLNGSLALAMGNYRFTCATTSEESKVEYTFGYKRCGDGKVRIFLHHSSLPYQPHSPPVEKGGRRRRWSRGILKSEIDDAPTAAIRQKKKKAGRKSRSSAAASDNVEEYDDDEDEDYDA